MSLIHERIFISSVQKELAEERRAVKVFIEKNQKEAEEADITSFKRNGS